jgi:hypothetical protein
VVDDEPELVIDLLAAVPPETPKRCLARPSPIA